MVIKPRNNPLKLKLQGFLKYRLKLSENVKQYYLYQDKGFEGEQKFDEWLENFLGDYLILNDLLLEINNTIFQIDSMLISQETIHLFEVKNYEGDYYIKDGQWYSSFSGNEIKDPLLQLKRSESLLRQVLQSIRSNFSIKSYIVFINPDFTLLQASKELPIIYPNQINRFVKRLDQQLSSKLNQRHMKLAEQLISMNLIEDAYSKLPKYEFDQLQKGITCAKCISFMSTRERYKVICNECGYTEGVESSVIRSVREFKLLFPVRKITTNVIFEWCEELVNKKRIKRILSKHVKRMGHGKFSYYV